jgi:hypothetical protein
LLPHLPNQPRISKRHWPPEFFPLTPYSLQASPGPFGKSDTLLLCDNCENTDNSIPKNASRIKKLLSE